MLSVFRREAHDNLYWSIYYPPNFGDWLAPYLYIKIAGHEPRFMLPNDFSLRRVCIAGGSTLSAIKSNCAVWGSGIMNRNQHFRRPWKCTAVRGPYTRQRFLKLGYSCPEIYGDPAILLPRFHQPPKRGQHRLGIVPHYMDFQQVSTWYSDDPSVKVVDVTSAVERVIDEITSCELTVSSSLHGLIISHAYKIPSLWVRFSDRLHGDGIKFNDYYASAGIPLVQPTDIVQRLKPEQLVTLVRDAVLPSLEQLQNPLLAACPFLPLPHDEPATALSRIPL